MADPTSVPEPATNWYHTRRHYSTDLESGGPRVEPDDGPAVPGEGLDAHSGPQPVEPTYLANPPAVGAPKGWPGGYLDCGCRNDGYGRHVQ
jgi:hypothetical protein